MAIQGAQLVNTLPYALLQSINGDLNLPLGAWQPPGLIQLQFLGKTSQTEALLSTAGLLGHNSQKPCLPLQHLLGLDHPTTAATMTGCHSHRPCQAALSSITRHTLLGLVLAKFWQNCKAPGRT